MLANKAFANYSACSNRDWEFGIDLASTNYKYMAWPTKLFRNVSGSYDLKKGDAFK